MRSVGAIALSQNAAMALALGVEVRRTYRILDDRVVGEHVKPRLLVSRGHCAARALARQVGRRHLSCHPEWM